MTQTIFDLLLKSKSSSSGLSNQEEEASNTGSHGRRSLVAPCRVGTGKSDNGRGSVGTGSSGRCSVTSSTGRGSSPVSSTASLDLTNRLTSHQLESDTSSLNSMECGPEQTQGRLSPKKRASLPAFNQPKMAHHMSLDPSCQEVVSGSVQEPQQQGMPPNQEIISQPQQQPGMIQPRPLQTMIGQQTMVQMQQQQHPSPSIYV